MSECVERRLVAILAADVAGYSRLMGADEEGTLSHLKALRRTLVDPAIAAHRVHTLPASPTFLNLLLVSEAWQYWFGSPAPGNGWSSSCPSALITNTFIFLIGKTSPGLATICP